MILLLICLVISIGFNIYQSLQIDELEIKTSALEDMLEDAPYERYLMDDDLESLWQLSPDDVDYYNPHRHE